MQTTTTFFSVIYTYLKQMSTKAKVFHGCVWLAGLVVINWPDTDVTFGVFHGGDNSLLIASIFGAVINAFIFYGTLVLVLKLFRENVQKFIRLVTSFFILLCLVEIILDVLYFWAFHSQITSDIVLDIVIGTFLLNGIFFLIPALVTGIIKDGRKIEKTVAEEKILVKDGSVEKYISTNDLFYIKSDGNYSIFFTTNGRIMVRDSLGSILEGLPDFFKRSHRSFIVNTSLIESKTYNSLTINNEELPIGRKYSDFMKAD